MSIGLSKLVRNVVDAPNSERAGATHTSNEVEFDRFGGGNGALGGVERGSDTLCDGINLMLGGCFGGPAVTLGLKANLDWFAKRGALAGLVPFPVRSEVALSSISSAAGM